MITSSAMLILDPDRVRDLAPEVMGPDGRMRVLPAAFWQQTTDVERAWFGHRHGIYGFPTTELVDHLRELIRGRSAIEIGAGHGVLADALGIPGVDNRHQEWPEVKAFYRTVGQPTVSYGRNIVEADAQDAVSVYRPQVVIGSWVTHRYDPLRHYAGGNAYGPDLEWIADRCETLILIGNRRVHHHCPLWTRPHEMSTPAFVYSRAHNGTPDFVALWERKGT